MPYDDQRCNHAKKDDALPGYARVAQQFHAQGAQRYARHSHHTGQGDYPVYVERQKPNQPAHQNWNECDASDDTQACRDSLATLEVKPNWKNIMEMNMVRIAGISRVFRSVPDLPDKSAWDSDMDRSPGGSSVP